MGTLRERAKTLGLGLSDDTIREVTKNIKRLADTKPLTLPEIDALLQEAEAKDLLAKPINNTIKTQSFVERYFKAGRGCTQEACDKTCCANFFESQSRSDRKTLLNSCRAYFEEQKGDS